MLPISIGRNYPEGNQGSPQDNQGKSYRGVQGRLGRGLESQRHANFARAISNTLFSRFFRNPLRLSQPDANLTKLANGIIDKCKYISDKHFDIVEQLVHDLKRRQNQDDEEDLDQQVHDDVSMDSVDDYMEVRSEIG